MLSIYIYKNVDTVNKLSLYIGVIMKYLMKYFDTYRDVVNFLNENSISKEDIIAISPTTYSTHHYDNRVVLIW